jgi:hypothetical protein
MERKKRLVRREKLKGVDKHGNLLRLNKKKLRKDLGTDTCCGKTYRFASKEAAEADLARILGTSVAALVPSDVYECKQGWWHFTSKGNLSRPGRIDPQIRQLVLQRDNNSCARCGHVLTGWMSIHHRLPGQMGGRRSGNGPQNLLALCGSGVTGCHGWIESNRTEAYDLGYLVRSGEDPVAVPVLHALYGRVFLAEDGTTQKAAA